MSASLVRANGSRHATPISGGDSTRDKLIEVAGKVFAEHGYHASTVREICAQAGSNVAAVNYHFGDKLGLYSEVLQQCVRASHVQMMRNALDQDAPPETILRAVIRARVEGVCGGGGDLADRQLRLLLHELSQPTPALNRLLREVSRPIYDRLLGLIGKLIGLPANHETTRLCVHSIMGQIMLYALAGPLFGRLWPEFKVTPKRAKRIANHIADFSLAYLRDVGAMHAKSTTSLQARRKR
jgi:AcrR family transcriptional regulator